MQIFLAMLQNDQSNSDWDNADDKNLAKDDSSNIVEKIICFLKSN